VKNQKIKRIPKKSAKRLAQRSNVSKRKTIDALPYVSGNYPRAAQAALQPPRIATKHGPSFPVVGVGASAGGLEALTDLLRNLPTDTGMAFVLVQHLAPDHESILTELLSRATTLPVREVRKISLTSSTPKNLASDVRC
jgi:chemotaxis response regulator CheB